MKSKAIGGAAATAKQLAAYDQLGSRAVANLNGLVACSELQGVDLVRVAVERSGGDPGLGPLPAPANWHVDVSAAELQVPTKLVAQGVAVIVSVQAAGHDGAGRTFAKAEVAVRVAYTFAGLTVAPEVALVGKFAEELALHHAWPFLRERLRSLSGEFGLPVVVLALRKR